jgi:predicted unusual protein kinase regulating ubiquinone biosynthesis (AarF/ABC1/UbiB family)
MVAMMIIEGLGRSLDPNLDLLVYAKPCVLNRAKKYLREEVGRRIEMATERVERMKRSLSLGGTAGELETDSMTYH